LLEAAPPHAETSVPCDTTDLDEGQCIWELL